MNAISCRTVSLCFIGFLFLVITGVSCARSASYDDDGHNDASSKDVILKAVVSEDQLRLTLENRTSNTIVINPIFNLGYEETSILFKFNEDNNSGKSRVDFKGIPEIIDPSTTVMTLQYNGFYGMNYHISEIYNFYSIKTGCYFVNAEYKNPVKNSEYTSLALKSNRFRICVP